MIIIIIITTSTISPCNSNSTVRLLWFLLNGRVVRVLIVVVVVVVNDADADDDDDDNDNEKKGSIRLIVPLSYKYYGTYTLSALLLLITYERTICIIKLQYINLLVQY